MSRDVFYTLWLRRRGERKWTLMGTPSSGGDVKARIAAHAEAHPECEFRLDEEVRTNRSFTFAAGEPS